MNPYSFKDVYMYMAYEIGRNISGEVLKYIIKCIKIYYIFFRTYYQCNEHKKKKTFNKWKKNHKDEWEDEGKPGIFKKGIIDK